MSDGPGEPAVGAESFEKLVPWIRSQYPHLCQLRDGTPRVYLDNAAGTLVPEVVVDAMADAGLWVAAQPGRSWARATRRLHAGTRELLRDFLNAGEADPVFLSESTTASLFKLRESLEPELTGNSEVVVTDCDHFANISAWEWRARWRVRRVGMLPDGGLDLEELASAVGPATRLVAIPAASNGLGTILPVAGIVRLVRERNPGALVVVDAVHAAPHVPIDVQAWRADAVAFSAYKLFGPFSGVLWVAPELAARWAPYHLEPHTAPDTLPEWGTLNNSTAAGICAALRYLERIGERLGKNAVGRLTGFASFRRRHLRLAMEGIRAYESALTRLLIEGLAGIQGLRLLGPASENWRVPTLTFLAGAADPLEVEERLWSDHNLQVAAGNHYSGAITRGLGLQSVVRASFAHYNDREDVLRLLAGVRSVADAEAGSTGDRSRRLH